MPWSLRISICDSWSGNRYLKYSRAILTWCRGKFSTLGRSALTKGIPAVSHSSRISSVSLKFPSKLILLLLLLPVSDVCSVWGLGSGSFGLAVDFLGVGGGVGGRGRLIDCSVHFQTWEV